MNIEIPPGYGLRLLPKDEWQAPVDSLDADSLAPLMGKLMIWEAPRPRGASYIIGVDVSNGVGLDRSVVDVLRVGNLTEPNEQVAQFISSDIEPLDLAYIIDPIGRFYRDEDGTEALVAIETNNSGISTQNELQAHLGYSNFYVWQTLDHRNPAKRFTQRLGWYTSRRTRPIIIDHYRKAISSVDPLTGVPDYKINSAFTLAELRDFQTMGAAWEAEAASGANDDCIMAGAVTVFIAHMRNYDEQEPIAEQRRRHSEETIRKGLLAERLGQRRDFQNTDATFDEMEGREDEYGETYD